MDEEVYRPQKNDNPTPPVEVPAEALSEEALRGIIESFISREGTDYGANEVNFETKIKQVEKQLEKGEIKIAFDPDSESVTLMTKHQWAKAQS